MPRARPKKRSSSAVRAAVNLTLLALLLAKLVIVVAVNVQTTSPKPLPINISAEAPPGIGPMVQRLLNWLYWGAWIVVFGVGIYGAIQWMMGDSEKGKKYLGGAIIGAIILAALTVLIPALVGG